MSYQEALLATGIEVLEFEEFGSYQGDWLALVRENGGLGVTGGCYGSCSGCDSFQAEFGWPDDEKEDYQERLADFGRGYLPAYTLEEKIIELEKEVSEYDWGDYKEMLDQVKKWQNIYEKN